MSGGFSRRRFLVQAGQLGCALPLLGSPAARWILESREGGLDPVAHPPMPSSLFSGLHWRMLGPFRGGRVDAVSGAPGRPHEFYFGAVNGGVWKTIDAGRTWRPVFDGQPVASIGALAVAHSAPDVVYVGTGESTLRDSAGYGNGVYRSSDAGRSWTHIGLEDTQHIGRIAVDPRNPEVVFVAAIGHLYAANEQRGIFRSRDGGRTWRKVLYRNPDVGAVEVVVDPTDPNVVYAGLWNTRRPPWFVYAPSNGPGGGIFKSTDAGDTWRQLTGGLPPEGIGRTGIAVCPSEPSRLYAVVNCLVPEPGAAAPPATARNRFGPPQVPMQGGLFRSDDAGATWRRLSSDQALWGRGWYFEKIAVDPRDADVVYVPNVAVNRSMDGGQTWDVPRGSPGGDDYHQMWISPDDPGTIIVASDQGCIITHDAKEKDAADVTWTSWLNQPTAQIYHVSIDPRFPYWVTGAQQDSGAVAVHSRGKFAEISMRDWEPIGAGGESGYTAGDPLHPGIIYGGSGQRYDLELNRRIPTTSPQVPEGEHARADWTQPLVLSQADPHALYYANQYLFRSRDKAATWTRISPDLTRPDPGTPPNLDAAAAANVGNDRRGVIYTIAPSPVRAPLIWIGTDDGWIQVSPDDGATWHNVTPPALTSWSRITMIEASHFDERTAYASVDRHQLEDFGPHIYRTRDLGGSWQEITSGLPDDGYVHTIREDPTHRGLLFAGTERGAFISFDDGGSWQPLQLNLPVTSVRDFAVYENDLVVATFGRGFWVIDGIAPLRQADASIARADAYLFQPPDTTVPIQGRDDGTPLQKGEPQADNPPDGVAIDYFLRENATSPVTLEVLDDHATVLATFSSAAPPPAPRQGGIPRTSPQWRPPPARFEATAGAHRVVWFPAPAEPAGRSGGVFGAPRVPLTGTFTARLAVAGRSYSRTFRVLPDPRRTDG